MKKYFTVNNISQSFHEVWKSLPLEAQQFLDARIDIISDDTLYLAEDSLMRILNEVDNKNLPFGVTETNNSTNKCNIVIFLTAGSLAVEKIKFLIAHEFAHVFLGHTHDISEMGKSAFEKAENEADELAAQWGFSGFTRDELCTEYIAHISRSLSNKSAGK